MKTKLIPIIAILGLFTITACQTVPMAERAKIYEDSMKNAYIGKSVDSLVLKFGPPDKSHELSDGRKLFQYDKVAKIIPRSRGQFSIGTGFGSGHYGYGGTRFGIGMNFPFPRDTNIDSEEIACSERFIIGKNNNVEAFAFEGKNCFN